MITIEEALDRLETNYRLEFIYEKSIVSYTKSRKPLGIHTEYHSSVKDLTLGYGLGFYFPYTSMVRMIKEELEDEWISVK